MPTLHWTVVLDVHNDISTDNTFDLLLLLLLLVLLHDQSSSSDEVGGLLQVLQAPVYTNQCMNWFNKKTVHIVTPTPQILPVDLNEVFWLFMLFLYLFSMKTSEVHVDGRSKTTFNKRYATNKFKSAMLLAVYTFTS